MGFVLPSDLRAWTQSQPAEAEVRAFFEQWFELSDTIKQFSSGSTGLPKEFVIAKSAMRKHAERSVDFFKLNARSRIAAPLPVSSIAWKMSFVRAQAAGGTWVWMPASTDGFLERLDRVDFVSIAPPQLHALIDARVEFKSKVQILVGGAAVDQSLVERLGSLGSEAHVWQSYGMSESISHVALRRLYPNPESSYRAMAGVQFDVSSEGGLIVSDSLTGLSLQTTDSVEWIDRTHFTWKGRLDAAIVSGGLKILPEPLEVEWTERLGREIMFSSLEDAVWGRALCLVVQGPYDAALVARIQQLNSPLSRDKKARWMAFVSEFPSRGAGKRDRKALEDLLAQQTESRIPLRS